MKLYRRGFLVASGAALAAAVAGLVRPARPPYSRPELRELAEDEVAAFRIWSAKRYSV